MTIQSLPAQELTVESAETRRKWLIAIVIVVVFLYWAGLYLYVSTLSVYVQSQVNNLAVAGSILSMYGLWQMIVRLPIGIGADWLGRRKPFILVGMLLVGAGALVLGRAGSIGGLYLGRAITGLAAGTWVPLVVVFSSLFKPGESVKAAAILTMVASAGKIVATLSNGFINAASGGYSLAFELAAVLAVAALAVMLFYPEQRQPKTGMNIQKFGRLVVRRDVLLPSLLNVILQYGDWTATFSFVPILAKTMGADGIAVSSLLSMDMAVVVLGNFLAVSLERRFSPKNLCLACFVLLALGIGAAAAAPGLAFLFAAQAIIGLAVGIGYPVMMGLSISKVEGSERTVAMGLHQAVYAIGMFAGPWLSGLLAKSLGISPMFAITACAILIAGLFGVRQYR